MKNIITTTAAPTPVPTPMLESISLVESQRLIELEKVIEGGRQTFVEVGTALAEIRDSQIYRSEHKSFDDYCRARWGWGKAYAYQLIGCAEVKKSPIGDSVINQAQAKELAKVPKTKRETVVKAATAKAKSAGRKLTAKDIKVAAQPRTAAAIVNPDEPATVTKPVESQPPSDLVNVAPKQVSTEDQLRLLWGEATPAERSSFLEWVKAQPVEEDQDLDQFKCNSCDAAFADDSEGVPLYECNDCGTRFTRDTSANDNHQCPDCNKFGSKVSDCGCPECGDGELEEIASLS